MYFPLIDMIQKSVKDFCRWFFVSILFFTEELRKEASCFFETGQTSFRHFEWLNLDRLRTLYPTRWKYVLMDFVGAYLKLVLLAVVVVLAGLFRLSVL